MTLIGRPPIWYSSPNRFVCQNGHALLFRTAGFHVDQRRVDGHMVVMCDVCKPASYAFAVVCSRPSPIVLCYAITREHYDWFRDTPDAKMLPALEEGRETEDLLHRLGYNPTYQRRS